MSAWLRSLAFNVWFFALTAAMALYGGLRRDWGTDQVLRLARTWAGLVLGSARRLCGIRVVLVGGEHLPQSGAALIASQHQSTLDTLVWHRLVPRPAYVFKAELGRVPLFGPLLHRGGQIAIGRGSGPGALRATLRTVDRAVAEAQQIVLFPEGTRVEPGARVKLQPGVALFARRTGLPVIPVVTNSGEHWGRRAFHKRPGSVLIVAGPPLPPGLSQMQLLDALRAAWDTAEARLRDAAERDPEAVRVA